MNRSNFIKSAGAISGITTLTPFWFLKNTDIQKDRIQKVHVIFKTHLDVGFTRLAREVMEIYFEEFIPGALDLSDKIRAAGSPNRYIWTTGSWLIWRYLNEASPANRQRMEQAIERGDIVWHALPFTTHTELADQSLFRLGLRISKELDRRFGKTTISAKMTDVPGHSRSMISELVDAGVKFLHIGVNPASTPPAVPPLCRWQNPKGEEVILMYQKDYGSLMELPGNQAAVSINFTGDNHGPHSLEQIDRIYQSLATEFPKAVIAASTLDLVTTDILPHTQSLPVVKKEIGDTWIHGAGSDPLKMANFRELSRLRLKWIRENRLKEGSAIDLTFGEKLLRVAEHTWGLDVKSHLNSWDVYEPESFLRERENPKFIRMEESWNEKREYLTEAIKTIPQALADEAAATLLALRPKTLDNKGFNEISDPQEIINTKHFDLRFDPETGAINHLRINENNRLLSDPDHPLGLLLYQTFNDQDYQRFFDQYLTQRPDWALSDFGKPGIEKTRARSETKMYRVNRILTKKELATSRIRIVLSGANLIGTGTPEIVVLDYALPDEESRIDFCLTWYNKPAYRLPEAIWLSFNPLVSEKAVWTLDKMGEAVSPLDIIQDGNRHLHAVQKGITCNDIDKGFEMETLDAFLFAPGERSLLNFTNTQSDLQKGFSINLFNNIWGTNFRMWYNENTQFRFTYSFYIGPPPQTKHE